MWKIKEQLKEQLSRETGYYSNSAGGRYRFALAYPNSYFVGMSNLGLHIVYRLLNERRDTACERVFLPEKRQQQEYEKARQPLMTLEIRRQTMVVAFQEHLLHRADALGYGTIRKEQVRMELRALIQQLS